MKLNKMTITYPSIIPNLESGIYHRHEAVSKHGLDDFRRAPAYYEWKRKNPRETTSPALLFGSLYHTAMLEPELLPKIYATVPADAPKKPTRVQREAKKPSIETIEAIQWWDRFQDSNEGKIIVDAEDITKCHQMREAMLKNAACRNALEQHRLHTEASLFWQDQATGVK
jgi:exodeoxyribonuclease VIII